VANQTQKILDSPLFGATTIGMHLDLKRQPINERTMSTTAVAWKPD